MDARRRPRSCVKRDGQPVGVARLDEEPGRADDLGQRARRPTRRPASRTRSPRWPAGRPPQRRRAGCTARAPRTSAGQPGARRGPGRRRGLADACRAAARASDARSSGLAPTSRTRGGQRDLGRRGRPAAGRGQGGERRRGASRGPAARRSGRCRRGSARQPEPLAAWRGVPAAASGRVVARRARERRPRRERDDAQSGRAGRGAAGARRRAVASLPTMTAAASRRSCARRRCPNRLADGAPERLGQLPRREVEQRDDDRAGPTRSAAARPRPRGRRRRPHRPARPARRRRAPAPRSRNGSTVIAADRSRRVGGSRRRPTTSRCAKPSVGSSRSDASRNANDSPSSGSASNAPSRPSR